MAKRPYTKRDTEYWENKGKQKKPYVETPNDNVNETIRRMDNIKKQDLGTEENHLREFMADGKQRDGNEIEKIKRLEDLIGISKANPFGTGDEGVFEESLEEKTKTDLQNLCIKVGIPTRATNEETKAALRREFKAFRGNHGNAIPGESKLAVDPNSPEGKKLKELLEN